MKFILMIMTLISCSHIPPNVNPEFTNYVKRFETEYGVKNTYNIQFVKSFPGMVIGECWRHDGYIYISKEWWDSVGYSMREQLITHEMCHCSCAGEHVEGRLSIMNPSLISRDEYLSNYGLLSEEIKRMCK